MSTIQSGRKTEDDGEFSVSYGGSNSLHWSEAVISVFDDSGKSVDTATGIVSGSILKKDCGKQEPFYEPVNLATDPWSWKAQIAGVKIFYFSVTGLNPGYSCEVAIHIEGVG